VGFLLVRRVEAFAPESDSWTIPYSIHCRVAVKAGRGAYFLVDRTLNGKFTIAIRATIVVLH